MAINEELFANALEKGNEQVFEDVYKHYFKPLYCYALTIVKDEIIAEEIVQTIFLKLWEKKEQLNIHTSLNAYLYKAVYFDSLNHLKHETVKSKYQTQTLHSMKTVNNTNTSDKLYHNNLEDRLRKALNELPEQCRTVFQLSRFQELKYREIATHLGISEKTVENHMGKALKLLRVKLVDFVTIVMYLFIHLKNNLH